MKHYWYTIIICLASLQFVGCATTPLSSTQLIECPLIFPLTGDVKVVADKIYTDNKIFAELRYIQMDKTYSDESVLRNPTNNRQSQNESFRGLAVYYYDSDKLVWLFPKGGADELIAMRNKNSQSWGYFGVSTDISISKNGRYVFYTIPGLLTTSHYAYSVSQGVSVKYKKN